MYKVGDIVEVTATDGGHGFLKGDQVRITAVSESHLGSKRTHYKCDKDDNGRKTSWYVEGRFLVKRRKK